MVCMISATFLPTYLGSKYANIRGTQISSSSFRCASMVLRKGSNTATSAETSPPAASAPTAASMPAIIFVSSSWSASSFPG